MILLLLLIVAGWGTVQAQLRINGYAAYLFDDSFDSRYSSTSYFYGKIKGGLQWGVGAEYLVRPEYGIELVYFRQDTEAPVNYYRNGEVTDILDLGINYVMLGGVRYLQANPVFEPYGGLLVGMAIYNNPGNRPVLPNLPGASAWVAISG